MFGLVCLFCVAIAEKLAHSNLSLTEKTDMFLRAGKMGHSQWKNFLRNSSKKAIFKGEEPSWFEKRKGKNLILNFKLILRLNSSATFENFPIYNPN